MVGAFTLRSLERVPQAEGDLTAHWNGFIDDSFERQGTPEVFEGLLRLGVRLLSFDLGPSCERVRMEEFYLPESPVLSPEDILRIGKAKIAWLRERFQGLVCLENLDYHPGGAYEHVCDPDFIRRALEEWDAGLTLDIGHMNVTCHQTAMSPEEYLGRLPLERLQELQVSHANAADDTHGLPTEEDYALVERVLRIARPKYVALEFYWDPDKIVEATRRLHAIARSARAAP